MNEIIIPTEYCSETIALKKSIESGFIVLGERLAKIKDNRMWEEQWSSFSEYLAEMNITDSTATKLISIHNVYNVKYSVEDELLLKSSWSTLYEILPLIKDKPNKEEVVKIIEDFNLLKREDQRELLREKKLGKCNHQWVELHLRICEHCNKKEKVYEE